jgi:hypothetical protein
MGLSAYAGLWRAGIFRRSFGVSPAYAVGRSAEVVVSRRWVRAALDTACGLCGDTVGAGEPMLELCGATWRKRRCAACAGESVPNTLPELARHAPITPRLLPPKRIGELPFDFKAAQMRDE